jgi:uroporphyrinogen decarboxylase
MGLQGAHFYGVPMREYFSSAQLLASAQLHKRELYADDVVTPFAYAAVEAEPFGQQTIFYDDGPPNAGAPVITRPADIERLRVPNLDDCPGLQRGLEVTRILASQAPDAAILGISIAPNSLPVMQMGFEPYLNLMYERPDLHERLLAINEEFCVAWSNAQLEAGAHAIGFFDPVSSPTIVPRELFMRVGRASAARVFAALKGDALALLASGAVLPVVEDFVSVGAKAVAVGPTEDLARAKAIAAGSCAVIGNLNGIAMRRWTPAQAEEHVKRAIAAAGPGGGYLLCDGHGEIPLEVPPEVVAAIAAAVHRWGVYPLDWE